jgi:malonyl-CoA decarboxylase
MTEQDRKKLSFLDRTLNVIQQRTVANALRAWEEITGTARALTGMIDPELPKQDSERIIRQMEECLAHKGGEVSARRRTIELGHTYLSLTDKGKERFLHTLSKNFDIDKAQFTERAERYLRTKNHSEQLQQESDLRDILEPGRMKILRQFNALPAGIKFLVDMRADLLRLKKDDPALHVLEVDLRKLLSNWFDIGLLDMQEISWNSPASLLEKLIAYEAVHAIRSWNDLKNRLDSDRRCFAFFHHKMPTEPLIFVEVALVSGIADNIQVLLDEHAPAGDYRKADTAIFYSISNAQGGLAGISFGNFLIKRVVDKLTHELPGLKHFVTLSPIPGFRNWLGAQLKKGEASVLTEMEMKAVSFAGGTSLEQLLDTAWNEDEKIAEALRRPLMRLCASYLLEQKKNDKALDAVANFHLSNGAQLERINWLADTSPKGIKQAAGMMVNYYYQLSKIEDNHEAYSSGKAIPAASVVKALLKK